MRKAKSLVWLIAVSILIVSCGNNGHLNDSAPTSPIDPGPSKQKPKAVVPIQFEISRLDKLPIDIAFLTPPPEVFSVIRTSSEINIIQIDNYSETVPVSIQIYNKIVGMPAGHLGEIGIRLLENGELVKFYIPPNNSQKGLEVPVGLKVGYFFEKYSIKF